MAFIHGKGTAVSLGGDDLSVYSNSVTFGRTSDSHDVTTFGKNAHVYQGGLLDGTCSIQGVYDDGAAGPRATIEPLIGTVVELFEGNCRLLKLWRCRDFLAPAGLRDGR